MQLLYRLVPFLFAKRRETNKSNLKGAAERMETATSNSQTGAEETTCQGVGEAI